YHPAYSFPFAVIPLTLAGFVIGECGRLAASHAGNATAMIFVGACCLLDLPSLVSHYVDGSRHDYRSAASFVASVRAPNEQIYAFSPSNLGFYEKAFSDARALDPNNLVVELNQIARDDKPAWLVLPTGRRGRYIAVDNWLNYHASLRRR